MKTENTHYEESKKSSFQNILEGCLSLRILRDKIAKGYVPSHFEICALNSFASNTTDGKEWILHNLKTSIPNDHEEIAPWSCIQLQAKGLCPVNTKCFDKKPPVNYVEGKAVIRNDVPESQWLDPSPIRYALGKGEDFLKKLMDEIDEVAKIQDIERKSLQLSAIVARVAVFDESQQELLKQHIEKLKFAKKAEINKVFTKANDERAEKIKAIESASDENFTCNGVMFKYLNPGYAMLRPGKKNQDPSILQLSDCFIDIVEERTVIEENQVKKKILFGKFTSAYVTTDFEIDSAEWSDNASFCEFFIKLAGIAFKVKRSDVDNLRLVIHHTSEIGRPGMQPCIRTKYASAPGWNGEVYLTKSVIVDKDGMRPNTDQPVYVGSKDQHASNIDFKILSDDEFFFTLKHLKSDFMRAFPMDQVMMGLGFTVIAGVHRYLGLKYKPIFWVEGTTGGGKTAFLMSLQSFYGEFEGGVVWTSTAKSVLDYAYQFQDSLLLTDDFKARTHQEINAVKEIVQNSYEYGVRAALNKDGTQRGDRMARCLFIMSGEEAPNDAAGVARMIILNAPQTDKTLTRESYLQVLGNRSNYKGVMARFIHWFLNKDKKQIMNSMLEYQDKLQAPISHQQNASRISFNTAMCYLGWTLFCDFMHDMGVATEKEIEAFKAESWSISQAIRDISAERCKDEQSAIVFLNRLSEMLSAGEVGIRHLEGYDREGLKIIGFVDEKDTTPEVCYIYPDTAIEAVKKSMAIPVIISRVSAGTQLGEMDALARRDSKGGPQIVKKYKGQVSRVWCVKLEKLGLKRDTAGLKKIVAANDEVFFKY